MAKEETCCNLSLLHKKPPAFLQTPEVFCLILLINFTNFRTRLRRNTYNRQNELNVLSKPLLNLWLR
jgi:hypothetical protein